VSELAKILFWVLVGTTVVQGLMVCRYFWALWHWKSRGSGPRDSPKAVAILCVRGNDPVLEACLAALLNQDYPSYDVRVVVDSRTDPAWEVVQAAVAREGSATRVQVEPLTRRRDTCSRKIAGVLQALAGLDEGYEVVALLDSDTIPHRTWLGELVAPLADPRCGAASGNRWYRCIGTGSHGAVPQPSRGTSSAAPTCSSAWQAPSGKTVRYPEPSGGMDIGWPSCRRG
jgi:cellulose synthase/poly-beta-1,6-N-acetylglucosamine synthase-like glycosyltransferase